MKGLHAKPPSYLSDAVEHTSHLRLKRLVQIATSLERQLPALIVVDVTTALLVPSTDGLTLGLDERSLGAHIVDPNAEAHVAHVARGELCKAAHAGSSRHWGEFRVESAEETTLSEGKERE